ncbi:hypothetical protein CspeluHIS016_0702270 [Cutaneotrichosporon spelunceum]|uniref:tRNA-dihydrouridine(47) synthase [NAD(P)(+)] n=1 Tax=Cutaneotrichosporon spelunceum TaxID=1672016 RepID=A0AAD3YEP7_9TREE|nr:hypothetical protein CspeluHIS016_0702270 [Cutaneotrichosporon spelunceum]
MTDAESTHARPVDDRSRRTMAGIAPVKAEYLIPAETTLTRPAPDDDAAEASKDCRSGGDEKRQKTKGGWKARTKGQKPVLTGERSVRMCSGWEKTGKCPFGDRCKYAHSWDAYFAVKPVDIHYSKAALSEEAPYAPTTERVPGGEDAIGNKIDLATTCPVYAELGYCTFGWRCRFLGGHVRRAEGEESLTRVGGWELLGFPDMEGSREGRNAEVNWPKIDVLYSLQKSKYDYGFSPKYLAVVEPNKTFGRKPKKQSKKKTGPVNEEDAMNGEAEVPVEKPTDEEALNEEEAANGAASTEEKGVVPGEAEAMDVPLRPEEKRRLNWDNGLYLAPLTTVGNLPFRRVCTDYGATITISEMALAEQIVQGKNEEWALVRRHESEKMFGVQLAGGWPNRMVPAAEVLARELGPSGIDFVDINMGCPIDLLFKQGAGSALMDNARRLGKICVGMNRALGEIPLTVKFRTGVAHNHPNAHKLIPRFATEWGASAMTLHGRSRQQRYTKLADWDYIKQCVGVLRESTADAGLPPVPIFGNGDCYSAQSYWEEKEASGVDGIMVARGALIKPWLFTEIAEQREWDISATERLEGIRKFAEYGLSHWGADTHGVNTTRRFLCEALSFQSRYVPIGLLERMPPMLNERPPAYRGRNELETLLSSSYVGDWVKISEMFLGPAGDEFNFQPKHKSNAYGSEEAQG